MTGLFLVCAVATGVVAGLAADRATRRSVPARIAGPVAGAMVMAGVSIAVLGRFGGLDFFGLLHLGYLFIVVSLPVSVVVAVVGRRGVDGRPRSRLSWALLSVGAVAALAGVWASHVEPHRLQLDRVELSVEGVEESLVVGVIADVQTGSVGDHERSAVARMIEAQPDLVVMPGDLFEFDDPAEIDRRSPEFTQLLRTLADGVGTVVIVPGDHDTPDGVAAMAAAAGVVYLDDDIHRVDVGDQTVTIVGLTVRHGASRAAIGAEVHQQMRATLRPDDIVLLVTHAPDPVLRLEPTSPVDLVVAGHTHGGQVRLPGFGPLLTYSSIPDEVAAGGLHTVGDHPIYVSTGVGVNRLQAPQIRFGVPPSVGLVTLHPE